MTCVHLRKLYQLCQQEGVKLAGADLIHLVCPQCGVREVCPSLLMDEYEAKEGPESHESGDGNSKVGDAGRPSERKSGFSV